jgi:hypothetical protein
MARKPIEIPPAAGKSIMRVLWLGVATLTFGLASGQARANTLIILLRSEQASIIAADSKVSSFQGHTDRRACKIHITDDVVWAAAGVNSETNGPFQINQIAEAAIKDGGSLDEITARFADRALAGLKTLLPELKADSPVNFDSTFKSGAAPFSVFLIKRGDARNVDIFMKDRDAPDRLEIKTRGCPGDFCPPTTGAKVNMTGVYSRAEAEMKQRPTIWREMGTAGAINYLMQVESAAEPEKVAGPVSILRIDRSGAVSWIQKGVCE